MKKIIVSLLVASILIAATYFGIRIYKEKSRNSNPVNAYSVSQFVGNYYEYQEGTSGIVQNSSSQEIYVNTNQIVSELKVSEGDQVKPGDVLLIYDTTAISLQLDTNLARLEQTRNQLTIAEHHRDRLYGITPVDDNYSPQPTEIEKAFDKASADVAEYEAMIQEFENCSDVPIPAYESTYTAMAVLEKKNLLMEAVYELIGLDRPVVDPSSQTSSKQEDTPAAEAGEGSSESDPEMLNKPSGTGDETDTQETVTEARTEKTEEEIPSMKRPEEILSEYEAKKEELILRMKLAKAELDLAEKAADEKLKELSEELTKRQEVYQKALEAYQEEQKKKGDEVIYTKTQLQRELQSVLSEIRDLNLSIRQQELSIRQQEKQIEAGTVLADMEGVISTADCSEERISQGKPVVVVSGAESVEVLSSIGEWKKDQMAIGTHCTIYCYDTGSNYEGTVTKIGSSPTDNSYSYSNITASNYPMTISIQDGEDLSINSWVQITFDDEQSGYGNPDEIVLPTALCRRENGNYYVMKDVGGTLKKQFIKTGKIYYGQMIVVKEGLEPTDYIAFPYDKNSYEGKVCIDQDDLSTLYGY